MELAQFHGFQPRTLAGVVDDLRAIVRPEHLHRRAAIGVVVQGPWRPADIWPGALERLAWSVGVESGGEPILTETGEWALARGTRARRHAPVHPVELLAERAGEGLVIVHSDAAQLAYVAVYRQRHLAWSLMLQDRVRLVRCDGQSVVVDEPPRYVAEGDRSGVLLAGLAQWLREPLVIDEADRYTFVDTLATLTGDQEPTWVVTDGGWLERRRPSGRAAAG